MPAPTLAIPVRADLAKFNDDMRQAGATVNTAVRVMSNQFLELNKNTAAAAGGATAFAAGWGQAALQIAASIGAARFAFLGFAAVAAAAIAAARSQLEDMLDVAERAGKVNVSPEFFQSFVKAGRDAADVLEKALSNAFNATKERLDQINGVYETMRNNALAGFFSEGDKNTGFDIFRHATSQDQKVRGVIVQMQELEAISQRLAAFDLGEKMFGAEFVDRIRRGEDTIQALLDNLNRRLAHGVGKNEIISDEQVARAKELDQRLQDAWRRISEDLKPSFEQLGSISLGIKNIWVQIVELIAKGADSLNTVASLMATALKGFPILGLIPTAASLAGSAAPSEQSPGTRIGATFSGLLVDQHPYPYNKLPAPRPANAPKAREEAGFSLDQVERFINALERSKEVTEAELATLGKSNVEREKAVALAQAEAAARARGSELTDEERSKVVALAEAHARVAGALADQRQKLQETAEAMRTFGQLAADAFADMILEGKSFNDVLGSIEKQLVRMALQAAFTGQGPLAGILGLSVPASAPAGAAGGLAGLFGGLLGIGRNAEGTDNWRGGWTFVGERGPELVNLPAGSQIVPMSLTPGTGGNVIVHNYATGTAGVEVRKTPRAGGSPDMEVIIQRVAARGFVERGGPGTEALAMGYGLHPALTNR